MNALVGFMVKEVHHILRDRRTLTVLLLLPLAQVLLFGYAVRTDIRDIRVAVVDPSPDAVSRSLAQRIDGTDVFTLVTTVPTVDALEPLFQRGDIDQALVFPVDFGSNLGRAEGTSIQVVTDATDPNTGSAMADYAESVIRDWTLDRSVASAPPRVVVDVRMLFNPTLESANLFVPGLMAVLLTVVSALMTAISLSREKEQGTLEILLVSPLRPWQIIVGKVLPYLALGVGNVTTVLLAATLVFGVPLRGSVTLLFAESLLFIVVSMALGVLVAAITSSQRTAMLGSILALMLPTIILSGMIFPIASMPAPLQTVSNVVPGRWFLVIARGIMLKGAGIAELWQETLVLTGMCAVLLTAAVRRFDLRLS